MPATDLLIDGYNLLHAAGYGPVRFATGELQRARQRLLKKLFQLLTPAEISQTAVVFDAKQPPPGLPKNWYIHGLRVMYAQPHGDADEMLEQLINEHSAPRQLTVVSSDHRLHRAARSRRAMVIKSEDFLAHLERRYPDSQLEELPDPAPTSPKATGEATSAEVDFWMRMFGDVKVSELVDLPVPSTNRVASQSKRSSQPAPAQEPTTGWDIHVPTPANVTPAPQKRVRLGTKKSPSQIVDDEFETQKSGPALFSQEWINDLQNWVDGIQRRS
jgi:predicted RNA-binding protein with PIN domain